LNSALAREAFTSGEITGGVTETTGGVTGMIKAAGSSSITTRTAGANA
jgi:hypothetical protein